MVRYTENSLIIEIETTSDKPKEFRNNLLSGLMNFIRFANPGLIRIDSDEVYDITELMQSLIEEKE